MTTGQLPFGTWPSPLPAVEVAAGGVRLGQVAVDGSDVYWHEGRPSEGGRGVIVRWVAGQVNAGLGADQAGGRVDVTPPPWDVRSAVHEYGGGTFAVADGLVIFSHGGDGRLYRLAGEGGPVPITPGGPDRYADPLIDRRHDRLFAVRERPGDGPDAGRSLVTLPSGGGTVVDVFSGSDFVSSPALHPEGIALVWLSWDHPNMPWDGTTLWRASLDADSAVGTPARVAGGPAESLFQPRWSPAGDLYVVSDRTGWWNLYRVEGEDLVPLWPGERESGLPQWVFGLSTYDFLGPDRVAIAAVKGGRWDLWTLDLRSGTADRLDLPFTGIGDVHANSGGVVFTAGSPVRSRAVWRWDVMTGETRVLNEAVPGPLPEAAISRAEPITYPSGDGQVAHAFYYPPLNPGIEGLPGTMPPLIVESHGGPTGATSTTFSAKVQFWTSRGFAVLDVDYRGSTGYGRAYREALEGEWGVADVDDCVAGARYLVERGWADPDRLIIRGSSASGFTTLAALTFRDTFRAGASLYGVSDLEALVRDTHAFESRYLDRLVGPYPEMRERYRERSPIHHVGGFSCPLIVFQGLDDPVVPPNQAEAIVAAIRSRGLPVAYVPFAGERHGFRRAETIVRALEAELSFYGQVFGFTPAGVIELVVVENLPVPNPA
ncbi:MAG: S9 family peptidase [Chloroflexota bacterium]|nr:S9 family peptidase [Chloroflexota bacterium]